MGGRNNKLCDQKCEDPKGVRQAKKPTKRNPALGQKDHFKCMWPANKKKQKTTKFKLQKQCTNFTGNYFVKSSSSYALFFPVDKSCHHYLYENMKNV